MRTKIINFLIPTVVLLLPLYLVRFFIFGFPTNAIELLILATAVLWIADFKKSSAISSVPRIYWFSSGLIFLGLGISAWLGENKLSEAGIIKGWFVVPFLFFLVLLDKINSWGKIEKLLKFFYVSAAGVGMLGLFYLWLGKLTFDGRLQIFYLSPNHLAMFLSPGLIFGIFALGRIFWERKKYDRSFYFLISSLLILFVSLYFTFSYAAWLAIFLSLALVFTLTNFLNRPRKANVLLSLLALAIILFSLQLSRPKMEDLINFDSRSSLSSRLMIWRSAWKIGTDNFFWGIGPGNFQAKYLEYQSHFPPYLEWAVPQPHNLFLAFWLQSGALGLAGFLVLVFTWIIQMLRGLKKQKSPYFGAALLAIMFYFLIHGLLDTPYWKNDLAVIFWLIFALGLAFLRNVNPIQMPVGPVSEK